MVAVELLNRCLSESPKGVLVGLDKGASVHVMEDGSQVLLQHDLPCRLDPQAPVAAVRAFLRGLRDDSASRSHGATSTIARGEVPAIAPVEAKSWFPRDERPGRVLQEIEVLPDGAVSEGLRCRLNEDSGGYLMTFATVVTRPPAGRN